MTTYRAYESVRIFYESMKRIQLSPSSLLSSGNPSTYCTAVEASLRKLIETTKRQASSRSSSDTVVYPILQMGPFGIHDEYEMLKRLFASEVS